MSRFETASTATLVQRAQRGETAAFEPLVRRHLRAAYAVALSIVGRPADAEDVAQDTFLVAFERIGTCHTPQRFVAWLLQIARHRALNLLESRRLRDVTVVAETPEQGRTDPRLEHAGLPDRLLAALALLPETQRLVVLLHDLDGCTHGEIAAFLEISEVMSRQHLFQARHAMRERLAQEESDGGHAMNDEKIDLSALDPSQDRARWEQLVEAITRQAVAATPPTATILEQLVVWARPALAVAAGMAAIVWLVALLASQGAHPTPTRTNPTFTFEQWVLSEGQGSAWNDLCVMEANHDPH